MAKHRNPASIEAFEAEIVEKILDATKHYQNEIEDAKKMRDAINEAWKNQDWDALAELRVITKSDAKFMHARAE